MIESPASESEILLNPVDHSINITRPIYTQDEINERLKDVGSKPGQKRNWKRYCSWSFVKTIFPIMCTVVNYKPRENIVGDILSGLSAACLHFPQGLAFGMLAGLAPAYGLYTSFFPLLFYMIFGTSHHVSFGTNAVIALSTAELVETAGLDKADAWTNTTAAQNSTFSDVEDTNVFNEDTLLADKAALAAGASFITGIILTIMGVCRLGVITSYLSSSFIGGFTTAAAFHIFTSQLTKGLGITIPLHQGIGKLILTYIDIFKGIPRVNMCSFITAVIAAAILMLVKECINERYKDKMKMPIPIDFIVVVAATLISYFANLNSRFGMKICGEIPTGVPAPSLPRFKPFDTLLPKSIEIAVLVFFITISMAKLCAQRHSYEINDNKELLAYGLSNFGSSFFLCFPAATAPPRTMLLSLMGAKTTLNNAFSAIVILAILLVVGQLFSSLPVPVLAAMVMVAVTKLLMQVTQLPTIYRINGYDFIIWVVTFGTAVLLDLVYGLICGLVVSLFVVALQSQRETHVRKLTSKSTELLMGNTNRDIFECTVIVAIESSLYFATAAIFLKEMRTLCATVTEELKNESDQINGIKSAAGDETVCVTDGNVSNGRSAQKIKYIVIDFRRVNYLDMKGLQALMSICEFYKNFQVEVTLCECNKHVQQVLDNSEFYKFFPRTRVFFTLVDAVEMVRINMQRSLT